MKTRLSPSASSAFTLIELLTVIAIIAVLMGLLFPALGAIRESARRTQAQNDTRQIVAAVKHYFTEYGKYPMLEAAKEKKNEEEETEDKFVGDPVSEAEIMNSALFNTLRAINDEPNTDHVLNPRKVIFFEGKAVSNIEQPKSGFLDRDKKGKSGGGGDGGNLKGSFFDPWGKQYCVMIDTNYDNVLDMGQCYTDFRAEQDKPRVGVGAFSMGKDNKLGDNGTKKYREGQKVSDDVVSWQ